jgi:ketosteroid isomerase-like protein
LVFHIFQTAGRGLIMSSVDDDARHRLEQATEIIFRMYDALRVNDYETVQRLCHEDFVFSSNAHPGRFGEVVEHVGTASVGPYRAMVAELWETLDKVEGPPRTPELGPGEFGDRGFVFNVYVRLKLRHRASGRVFEGTKRQEWVVQNGKIAAMAQYLDKDLIGCMLELAECEKIAQRVNDVFGHIIAPVR